MPPDLNTLPTSRPPSMPGSPIAARPRRISISNQEAARPSPPSPRSPSLSSLQAAATINASLHHSPARTSPSIERRRSSLLNNLIMNDPAVPAPGELQQSDGSSGSNAGSPRLARRSLHTADPHHQRQPSLGELHQELENEQEAQVNRLLQMIKVQQEQLAAMQRQQNTAAEGSLPSTEHARMPSPLSTLPIPVDAAIAEAPSPMPSSSMSTSAAVHQHLNWPQYLPALVSFPGSRGNSPALPPQSGGLGALTGDFLLGGTRDDAAFYQAETQMLTRENQMLKLRIRELEHQIGNLGGTHVHQHSPLTSPPATFGVEGPLPIAATSDANISTKAD